MFNKLIILASSISLTLVACGGGDGTTSDAALTPTKVASAGKAATNAGSAGSAGNSSTGNAGQGPVYFCTPGGTQGCVCPSGQQGAQSCLKDGSGWDVCECGGGNAGNGNAGSAGDAAAGATGGSGTGNTAGTGNAGAGNNTGTGNVAGNGKPCQYVDPNLTDYCTPPAAGAGGGGAGGMPATCQTILDSLPTMFPADYQYTCSLSKCGFNECGIPPRTSDTAKFDQWGDGAALHNCLYYVAQYGRGHSWLTKCGEGSNPASPACIWDSARGAGFCK